MIKKGGHYFNPNGMWSLLADEANQISHETNNQQISDDEMHLDIDDSSLYIDDE